MTSYVHKIVILLFIWIAAEENVKSLEYKNFRCDNGAYILNSWFCDGGSPDCDRLRDNDRSDESFGCDRVTCGKEKFKCSSDGACINITHRCNTVADCDDHSDELNCGNETDIMNCSLHIGKFLCHDNLKCLDYVYTCNGVCNCFDCSDENADNCSKFDSDSCRSCQRICLPTPDGPQCTCNSSQESGKFCKEIQYPGGSYWYENQNCYVYNDTTRCRCYENFFEVPESRNPHPTCKTDDWFGNVLLYSTYSKIKALNMTNMKAQIIQNDTFNHTALTGAHDYIYYANFQHGKYRIFKAPISGGETDTIIESHSSITSLSVDWITQNIYFTSNGSILACTNDGKLCAQLEGYDADNVVLVPLAGQLYYSEKSSFQNERSIMKSNMDGSEKKLFLDASFADPISLAIDEDMKTLYWFELRTHVLYSFLLDDESQTEQTTQIQVDSNVDQKPFSQFFTTLGDQLYFTKRLHANIIYSALRWTSTNTTPTDFHTDIKTNAIIHLYGYNFRLQRKNANNTENPCEIASCDGLCLIRPFSSSNLLNYTCMCENHSTTNGSHWCNSHSDQPIENFILNPSTEFTQSANKRISSFTRRDEHGTTTQTFHVDYSAFNLTDHTDSAVSSETTRSQYSKSDVALGFMTGVALILGVFVLYLIFEKVYAKRSHRQMEITELMDL